ncbi:hypothetical protein BJ508DRAFT_334772, partial [Ascobolus immersus RN42]
LHFPLYTSTLHHTPPFPPRPSSLGPFDRLPLELQCLLLRTLPVREVYAFRSASSAARTLVHHLPEYHALLTYTPNLLRAVIKTDTTGAYTLPHLYRLLTAQPTCTTCPSFGPFLSLPLARRFCLPCLTTVPEAAILPLPAALQLFPTLTPDTLAEFTPLIRTLPLHGGVTTVSALIAKALTQFPLEHFPGKRRALETYVESLLNYGYKDEVVRMEMAKKDLSITVLPLRQPQRTVLGREGEQEALLRRMTAVPMPWLNLVPNTRVFDSAVNPVGTVNPVPELELGVVCTACSVVEARGEAEGRIRARCYTSEGFMEHYGNCREAREWSRGILVAREEGVYLKLKRYLDECRVAEGREVKIY